jgi:hypothetical protein
MKNLPASFWFWTSKTPILREFLRRAEDTGALRVSSTSLERWSDGDHVYEGYNGVDLYVKVPVRLTLMDLKLLFHGYWLWFLDWIDSVRYRRPLYRSLPNLNEHRKILLFVNPLSHMAYRMAEEDAFSELESSRPENGHSLNDSGMFFTTSEYSSWLQRVIVRTDEIMSGITADVALGRLLQDGYVEVVSGISIRMDDPGDIVVDEQVWPFDLKDGWSKEQIAKIVEHALSEHLGVPLTVRMED